MRLSVLTFNVYNHADFDQRLPLVLDALSAAAADIVCLQEVPPGQGRSREIAGALGYQHWADVEFTRPDDGWSEGLALLSRFSVLETEPLELRPEVLNCLRTRLDIPSGPLDVYNVHLHPRDSALRQREASTIVGRLQRAPEIPALVAGDFNAVPAGQTMAVLWPHLRSAFELAAGHHPGTTFPTPLRPLAGRAPGFSERREAPPTDDESQARAAIDYVLVRHNQFRALEARVIGASPAGDLWPSDHFGVFVRLELVASGAQPRSS